MKQKGARKNPQPEQNTTAGAHFPGGKRERALSTSILPACQYLCLLLSLPFAIYPPPPPCKQTVFFLHISAARETRMEKQNIIKYETSTPISSLSDGWCGVIFIPRVSVCVSVCVPAREKKSPNGSTVPFAYPWILLKPYPKPKIKFPPGWGIWSRKKNTHKHTHTHTKRRGGGVEWQLEVLVTSGENRSMRDREANPVNPHTHTNIYASTTQSPS